MPTLTFDDEALHPATQCRPLTVSWSYHDGPQVRNSSAISLSITGLNTTHTQPVTSTVATNIDPTTTDSFRWPLVVVPPGWYILTASMPARAFTANSSPFFVQLGSDSSCLPRPVVHAPSNDITTTTIATATAATATAATATAVTAATTNNYNDAQLTVALALCASLGSFALLMVLAIALHFYIKRRRGRATTPPFNRNHRLRKGRGSCDSRAILSGSRGVNDSQGTVVLATDGAAVEKCSIRSRVDSTVVNHDDVSTLATLPKAARSSSSSPSPPLVCDRPRSVHSLASNRNIHTHYPPSSPPLPQEEEDNGNPTPPRKALTTSRSTSSLLSSPPSHHPPPAPISSSSSAPRPPPLDLQTSNEPTNINRPSPTQAQKQKRKPVPQYDNNNNNSNDDDDSPSSLTSSQQPGLSTTTPSPVSLLALSPTEAFPFVAGQDQKPKRNKSKGKKDGRKSGGGGGGGHYVTRKYHHDNDNDGNGNGNHDGSGSRGRPDLAHKSSFGPDAMKPMRVIMPDLPSPGA